MLCAGRFAFWRAAVMPPEQFQRFRALDTHVAAFDPLKEPLPAAGAAFYQNPVSKKG